MLVLTVLVSKLTFGQVPFPMEGDKIVYSSVQQVDSSLKAETLLNGAKEFFALNPSMFNRGNSDKNFQGAGLWFGTGAKSSSDADALHKNDNPLKLCDRETQKIIGRVATKYTGGTMGCIRILYLTYDVILQFKDGRYKYELTNFNYTHYNQATMKRSQIYGFDDSGPCNSENTLENLLDCSRCKNEFSTFYNYLNSDVIGFIEEMKKYMQQVKDENDDW